MIDKKNDTEIIFNMLDSLLTNIPSNVKIVANDIVKINVIMESARAGPVSPSKNTVGNKLMKIKLKVRKMVTLIFCMMFFKV